MKKNELITLGAGTAVLILIMWVGGIFSLFASSTPNLMSQQPANNIPEVTGPNISTDPKLQIIEVQQGTGTSTAKNNSHVYVHYTGRLQDGTVFDSSINRGTPIDFLLGQGKVIKGWDLGLQNMKVGGKRRLIVDPEYAYGVAGAKDSNGRVIIPPNATLIFDVEMIDIRAK